MSIQIKNVLPLFPSVVISKIPIGVVFDGTINGIYGPFAKIDGGAVISLKNFSLIWPLSLFGSTEVVNYREVDLVIEVRPKPTNFTRK